MSAELPKAPDDPVENSRMSLGEHLDELRTRLLRATVVSTVVLSACFYFHEDLAEIILEPHRWALDQLDEHISELNEHRSEDDQLPQVEDYRPLGLASQSGFFFYFKISFYFALFIAGPYILWELWQFIAAGLYKKEKRVIHLAFPFSALLFLSGVLFGFEKMLPYAHLYLMKMSVSHVNPLIDVGEYFRLLTNLTFVLGFVFQLPLVMMALSRVGLVDPKNYSKHRGFFLIGALVIAAILTPPDPFTQLMMAVPMAILYEIGHIMARVVHRKAITSEIDTT